MAVPLRFPCIRHLLIAQMLVTGLALAFLFAWFFLHIPQRLQTVAQVIEANHLSTTLLQAAIAGARERGISTLYLLRPVLSEEIGGGEQRWAERLQDNTSRSHNQLVNHLQELLSTAPHPELSRQLTAVRRQYSELRRARREVGQSLRGEPTPLTAEEWFETATAYINSLGQLQAGLCTLPRELLAPMAGCLLLKDEIFWLGEYAGRIRGIMARAIAGQRPLTRLEQYRIYRYRAGVERRLQRLASAQAQWFPDNHRLANALDATRQEFQTEMTGLFDRVFEVGVEGGDYPVNALTWFEHTSEGIESLRSVILATTEAIDAAVAKQRSELIWTSSLWALTAFAFALTLGALAFQIHRRLLVRLAQLHDATSTIGSGNLSHPVAVEGEDELSELARDFEAMRTHLLSDIGHREATEKGLRRANEELQRFTSVVSHDLKAPLRSVHGLSSWIEEEMAGKLSPEGLHRLELLRNRVERMDAMINALLEYSRAGRKTAEIEVIETRELVHHVVEEHTRPEGFTVSVAPDLPRFKTDPLHLKQVFANLIGNAIEHHDRTDGNVWVSVRDNDQFYEFSVIDDGPGIPADQHQVIFAMFQRLQPGKSAGTGIGLSLVKKIVEGVGGEIAVDSAPGQGSTFRFTWPKVMELGEEN